MPELPINLSGTPTYKRSAGASADNLSVANVDYNPLNDTALNYVTPKKSGYDASSITMAEAAADRTGRYKTVMYGYDNEEAAAQRQGFLEKGANGILKGVNLTATTIAGGFGMLYGAAKSPFSGRLADIWDNEVMRGLDEWNKEVDDKILPNYYTKAERDAAWYSPSNWFTANFLFDKLIKNSGYAVGAMLSGNIANAGLIGAGSALGRVAAAGAVAAESSQAFKLFTPLLRNTARAFSAGKNIEAAAVLEKQLSSIADVTARSSELSRIARTTGKFAEFSESARRTAIAAYSSAGEASFEALQTGQQFKDSLIQEYVEKYGEQPTGEILEQINRKADQVGKTSFFGNLALLSATEYVQLPYLLGSSYKNTRQAANTFAGRVDDIVVKDGKYVAEASASKFGKIYEKATGVGKYVFDPKESAQEVGQFALQVGTQNYFSKAFEKGDADIWVDGFVYGFIGKDEEGKGEGALVSKEGMESFLLGGLTGGPLQAKTKIQERKVKAENTQRFLDQLNRAPSFKESFIDRMNSVNRGVVLQEQHEAAVITGNELEARDLRADMTHNYLAPRIKYGRFDMVLDDVSELRTMSSTQEGLAELKAQGIANVNDTVESFQKRLNNFEITARNTNDIYNNLYIRYSGERTEEGDVKYSPYVLDKMAYAASKVADYDVRIPQLNSILMEKGIVVGEMLDTVLKGTRPSRQATAEALNQINDLSVVSSVKDGLKTALQDIITLGERRKMFLDEYEDIKENPLNYESDPEFNIGDKIDVPLTIDQPEKKIEIGKEYSLIEPIRKEGAGLYIAPKLTVLSQTLGGELEVKLPSGKVKFLAPEDLKQYNISEEDNASEEMNDVLEQSINAVLAKEEYKDLPEMREGESKLSYINSLNDQKLIDEVEKEFNERTETLLKQKEEERQKQQEIIRNRAELEKQQSELEIGSGTVATPAPPTPEELQRMLEGEGRLKAVSKLFISSTSPTEDADEPVHIRNSREFLNNAKNFKNRSNLAAILVTPNQEAALGLNGLTALSYGTQDATDSTNVDNGFVAQVFVEQEAGKTYFVNKNGERIGEIGKPVDIQQVIFQTMPTTSLYDRSGQPRFRANQMAEAEIASKQWALKRKEIFEASAFPVKAYKFSISRGIPIINIVDGKYERNPVGGILVPENKIATQEGLLQVVTQGSVTHNGENIKFNNGLTVLQYGDTLQIVNNNPLGEDKANAVYLAIKTMMEGFQKNKKLDINLATYIQNVLFWRKTPTTSGNQIFINSSTGEVSLGGKNYNLADLTNKKREIVDQLKDAFHGINNTTLKNKFYEKFYEYKVENDQLIEVEWPNYQSYLLSSKGRSASQTPLVTSVAKPTDAIPYSFQQKYSTLVDFELPLIQAPKPAPAKQAVVEDKPMVGEFVMDGSTKNTFNGFKSGPVEFTGTIDAEGNISVDVTANATIEKIAANAELVNGQIVPALKDAKLFDALADDTQLVTTFIALKLAVELKGLQTVAPKPAAPPVSDIEGGAAPSTDSTYNPEDTAAPDDEYMRVGGQNAPILNDAQIEIFKDWAEKNVPGIPYEVLDNLVTTYDNEKAWGVFEKGVAKFYKGAPGTAPYHEVFEGVWKGFLTPEQRQMILDEFKSKSGQFTDRASGKKIAYDAATDQQAKERIADDFAEFRMGKLPARTLGEKILKFFRNIIEFFKSFVQKPSMKEQLFKAIDSGKFKEAVLPTGVEFAAPEYMRIPGLTETQAYEFVQDMTARAAQYIFGESKKSLYDLKEITGAEIFNKIKEAYTKENKYQTLGDERYNKLVIRTKEKLRTLGINFNDEDTIDINDENVTNRDYAPEPFSTDWKKTSPFAIKFVTATLPEVEPTNQQTATSMSLPKRVLSSIKGYKLSSFGKVFNTLLDKLSNTSSVKQAEDKLADLSKFDATYVRFFQRVGGDLSTGTINFDNFKNEDWRLFINFFQTFTKQKPDAVIQYIDGTSVYTVPANQFTASKMLQNEWFENMKMLSDDPKSIIKKNKKDKTFDVDKSKLPTSVPKEPQAMVDFLANLGVSFPITAYQSLKSAQKNDFANAVSGIYTYIQKTPSVGSLMGKTLGINSQLASLANLYIKITNPSQDSTYFGVENQRIQSFAENNVPSVMENEFNSVNTVEELKQLRPELNDVFSKNSITLKDGGNFYNAEGERVKSLKIGYIQGTKILDNDKGITTAKLTLGNRFTQEINENLNGNYYILVPADGSTEWTINLGNHMTFADVVGGRAWTKISNIFRGYLTDEIALALDADSRKQIRNVGAKANQLRFFKEILSEKDVNKIEAMIADGSTQEQIEKYVDDNIDSINSAVRQFIENTVSETRELLINNNQILQVDEDIFTYSTLQDSFASKNDINKFNMNSEEVNNLLTFVNANYVINNIELHKLIFGDPYEFAIKKGKLDETKRIKSFLSPRRTTFDSGAYNAFLNKEYNTVGDIELAPEDPGYHLHKSYTTTATLSDVELSSDLYPNINEADAASMIMDGTYREVKLKNGQWTTQAEEWHQWQMAYTRNKLAQKGIYKYTNEKLQKADNELISKPEPVFVTDVLKPIVSGVKAGEIKIDNVLDKFSQMPLYYKAIEGRNLEKLYLKMWRENIGYVVFESGRKVGATKLNKLYAEDGSLNQNPFEGLVKVPWKAYGIQVETAFENPKDQTRGSQLTKLSSLDMFKDGEASEQAKKAYERNLKALDKLHEEGYKNLLNKLGLEDLGDGYRLVNPAAVQEALEYELLRREMAENAKDTIKLDDNGQFIIPFEASPAYRQIKDILFSMVNKSLVSPKMNGGPKVQVPVTGWEKTDRKGNTPNPELKFYTKEDPYMEVLLPHWFRGKFNKKKFPTDEAILKYLNSTEEGKSILRGVGFRIPTQAMSSIETFRVKGFLPQSMGDTIVVPSEITAKAGSDFDIDKMNTYLKSTYVDKNGDIKLVKYQGSEEATKEFFTKVFNDNLQKQKLNKAELLEAVQILSYGLDDPKNLVDRYSNLFDVLLEDVTDTAEYETKVIAELERLGDENLQEKLRQRYVDEMYMRSLQNEYYESLEQMITLPENFDRLISPVDDAGLSKVAGILDTLRNEDETAIKGRLLNRSYMTSLRNAFVTAKKWVGIAAVNITGQSLTQKAKVYIDPSKFEVLSEFDKNILGDGKVQLPHNTVKVDGEQYISISGKTTADGKQFISDRLSGYATSFVDVAKDPYIMKIIGADSVVGLFMFLERIGVGENTIWFMNQPIIREYLSYLDSIGKKGLFGKKDREYIRSMFPTSNKVDQFDPASLKDNIQKYYNEGLNNEDNAVQQAIFTEFLKYAKMAEYNFKLTQATNYDTTKFRNSDEFNRKQSRTAAARDMNIFSSVDKILDSSFIGKQANFIDGAMSSLGEIIKTERDDYAVITNDVLKPFMDKEFMSADEFNRVAGKIKASFLDYIVQTQSGINSQISELVVGNGSVADQLAQAKQRHPEMKILNDLQVVSSDRIGGAKSIKLRANLKDAYDEDMYTDMMRELRSVEPALYNGLLKIAVLQGVYQSSISIKNIMPIEDYAPLIKKTIDTLSSTEDVKNFSKGAFYKNNWKDDVIVPSVNPKFFLASEDPVYEDAAGNEIYQYFSYGFPNIEPFGIRSTDRKVLLLSEIYNASDVQNDFVKVPRIVTDKKTGAKIDMVTGKTITNVDFARRKAAGDMSLKDVFGYQKVKYANGKPVVTAKGEHVYKLVNLYGDGQLVSEYYLDARPSVINNGTVKIDNEVSDADLIKFYGNQEVIEETVVPSQPVETTTEKINIYAGTGENADLSNFAIRPFTEKGDLSVMYEDQIGKKLIFKTVEGAFQAYKIFYSDRYNDTELSTEAITLLEKFASSTGAQAKDLGKTIKGLDIKQWDENSSEIMKDLLTESFMQNPAALERLLATGNATLTHKYKGVEQDKGRFSKLLMEVRDELRSVYKTSTKIQPEGRPSIDNKNQNSCG
jgi:predicted NAD-dependent protein-ADP-ribosyltransferase YbiA (DUF1768 family)